MSHKDPSRRLARAEELLRSVDPELCDRLAGIAERAVAGYASAGDPVALAMLASDDADRN